MTVDIDREKAAVYGVTVDQVRNQLYNAFGSRQVGTIYMPSNDYQIILEAQPQFRVDPSDLSKLYMKTANGQTIPLDAVAKLVPTVGPLQINHQGQQPAVTISFNLAPGYSLGYAVDKITELEQASNLPVDHRDRLLRHRAGVPGFAARAGRADPRRGVRGLRDPRHPL